MSKIGNRKHQHFATVKRFGDRRIFTICSCGSHMMARVNDLSDDRISHFKIQGRPCPALALAYRRLKIA